MIVFKMRSCVLVITCIFVCGLSTSQLNGSRQSNQTTKIPRAVVHVVPFDVYGTRLDGDVDVEEFRSEDNRDFAKSFNRNTAMDVPFGVYTIRLRLRGFWSTEKQVRVFQPIIWIPAGLEVGMEGGPRKYDLSGHVQNTSNVGGEPVWLHLIGVYSGAETDTQADASGNFTLAGVPDGAYVLVTTQRGQTVNVRTVKVPVNDDTVLMIKLSEEPK